MDAAELAEQGEVLVRRLEHPARVGVDGADDGEIGGERVELKERVVLTADGPRDQEELVDRPLVRAEDSPELSGIHVAGRLEDHSQGFAGDRHDAFHDPSLA